MAFETIYAKEKYCYKVGTHLAALAGMSMMCRRPEEAKLFSQRAAEVLSVCYGPKHPLIADCLAKLNVQIDKVTRGRSRRQK